MKKIGIILHSPVCNSFQSQVINRLGQANDIELWLVLVKKSTKASAGRGVFERLRFFLVSAVLTLEAWLSIWWQGRVTQHETDVKRNIEDNQATTRSIEVDSWLAEKRIIVGQNCAGDLALSEEDVKRLKGLKLDLFVSLETTPLRFGDFRSVSKEGCLYLSYDAAWMPDDLLLGFWEVYRQSPSMRFVVHHAPSDGKDTIQIVCSDVMTLSTCFRCRAYWYKYAYKCLSDTVAEYVTTGNLRNQASTQAACKGLFSRIPEWYHLLGYLRKIVNSAVKKVIRHKIMRRHERWSISFAKGEIVVSAIGNATKVQNVPGHFYADPFVIHHDDRTICYVEDYDYVKRKGAISALELFDNGTYEHLGIAIEESFHMSFPCVFEFNGDIYMVPETSKCSAGGIRLYKCTAFPLKWEFQHNLLSNVIAVDSLIFEYNDCWWLFSNLSQDRAYDPTYSLCVYSSKSPVSTQWQAHVLNPVKMGLQATRNGGMYVSKSGELIHCRQRWGFCHYGAGLNLIQMRELSNTHYSEKLIGEFSPYFSEKVQGLHHLHSNGQYFVFDTMAFEDI